MTEPTTEPTAAQKTEPEPTTATTPEKTFTQAELDNLIKDRLERERKKYSDYADLKKAKDELDGLKAAKLSDEEKAASRLKALEDKIAAKDKELSDRVTRDLKRAKIEQAIADGKMKLPKGRTIESLVKRMIGTSEEEIDEDLSDLMGLFPPEEPSKSIGGGSQQTATKPPDVASQLASLTEKAANPATPSAERARIQEQILALKMKAQGGFKIV